MKEFKIGDNIITKQYNAKTSTWDTLSTTPNPDALKENRTKYDRESAYRKDFGNLPEKNKQDTVCHKCGQLLIRRHGFKLLANELAKKDTGNTLYILDEPTTGLHFEDIRILMNVVDTLVDKGNTVVVIEHNPDVILAADYLIDLGPEGGDEGGEVLVTGTPYEIMNHQESYTGEMLRELAGVKMPRRRVV